MSSQDDVRRIARALPGVIESKDHFAFSVDVKGKAKGFAWVWMERIHPKKARVPQLAVLAVRVADQTEKAALLDGDPDKFFTEPHYNGFPAVLVRLANVTEPELSRVLVEGWRCMAHKDLVAAYEAEDAGGSPAPSAQAATSAKPTTTKPNASTKPSASKPSASARPKSTSRSAISRAAGAHSAPSAKTASAATARDSASGMPRARPAPPVSQRAIARSPATIAGSASTEPKAPAAPPTAARAAARSASGKRAAAGRSRSSHARNHHHIATRKRGR
jgi:hypothetical protein